MKKLFILVSIFIAGGTFASEKLYFEQPAKLAGKLSEVKSRHPNPEFGGKPQPAIFLMQPIDVLIDKNSKNNQFDEVELNVTKIQLAYGSELSKKIKAFKNKKVSILCADLFHAHTGHHTTEVLCSVKEINLLK